MKRDKIKQEAKKTQEKFEMSKNTDDYLGTQHFAAIYNITYRLSKKVFIAST